MFWVVERWVGYEKEGGRGRGSDGDGRGMDGLGRGGRWIGGGVGRGELVGHGLVSIGSDPPNNIGMASWIDRYDYAFVSGNAQNSFLRARQSTSIFILSNLHKMYCTLFLMSKPVKNQNIISE